MSTRMVVLAVLTILLAACGGASISEGTFETWVDKEVDPAPIQAWLLKQKGSTGVVAVAAADWPAEIQRLHPDRVELWRDGGVVLTWGKVGHDGDRRQVFIGRTAKTPPPTEMLWLDDKWADAWVPIVDHWPADWLLKKAGVWWWFIHRA